MINAGVYQVVIGTDVADLFAELEPMLDLKPDSGSAPAEKKGVINTVVDFIAGSFQPIIPALSGAGMLRALMAILVAFHLVDTSSQTYAILNFFGDAVFYFLPILLAFCQAQKLKCNPVLAPALLIGGLLPLMVMFGLHNGVAPLGVMQMSDLGYDSIFGPGCVCSNIAQGVAALVVALRTKSGKDRQISVSGGITALMGITEPVLYGVNLPKKYPLIAAMIGGGCGGLYAGITHTHRFATGSSGLPAVFLYIGDNTMTYFYNIIIALVITAVVTAIVTFVLSLCFEKAETAAPAVPAIASKPGVVCAPVSGEVVAMTEIPDETFAAGVLGEGVGIKTSEGRVVAPFSGTISSVAGSHHAVGVTSPEGLEVLIHVGVDTVDMGGKGFTARVKEGDTVAAGQELIAFDRKAIQAAGHPDIVVVLLTNAEDYETLDIVPAGTVSAGAEIIRVPQTVSAQ